VYRGGDSTDVVGATFYSLGNFVSNQRGRRTDGGIAAEIILSRRDTLPLRFDFGWRPLWVHTPIRGGVRRYEVLPLAGPAFADRDVAPLDTSAALDTLPEPARTAARQFLTDTGSTMDKD
jgi:hypothetical protein